MRPLNERRTAMKQAHAQERERLDKGQAQRRDAESRVRSERLRTGVMGVWDRLTGRRGRTVKLNEEEAFSAFRRDKSQRDALVGAQLGERRELQRDIRAVRHRHAANVLELHRDLARQDHTRDAGKEGLGEAFGRAANAGTTERSSRGTTRIMRARGSERGASRDGPRGPSLGR